MKHGCDDVADHHMSPSGWVTYTGIDSASRYRMSRSAIFQGRTFAKFRLLDKMDGNIIGAQMTEQTHAGTARGRFLHAVQKELAEFERRETEFSKMLRKERAAELQLPGIRDNNAEFGGVRNRIVRN